MMSVLQDCLRQSKSRWRKFSHSKKVSQTGKYNSRASISGCEGKLRVNGSHRKIIKQSIARVLHGKQFVAGRRLGRTTTMLNQAIVAAQQGLKISVVSANVAQQTYFRDYFKKNCLNTKKIGRIIQFNNGGEISLATINDPTVDVKNNRIIGNTNQVFIDHYAWECWVRNP